MGNVYTVNEILVGSLDDRPAPDRNIILYVDQATGKASLADGTTWNDFGGASYPGVTTDGEDPPGILIDHVVAENAGNATNVNPGYISLVRGVDNAVAIQVNLSPGSSGQEIVMNGELGHTVWEIDADGSEALAAGLGRFGAAPPPTASAITGALSTVTDPAAKAVLTSLIAALTADGGATDSTT